MAAGLGFKTFTTGEVLTAANVNGYLMQGVLVFASAAARDAAITSPQEGQFAYTKDTNGLWYYDGAAWVASGATGDIEGVTAGTGISGGGTSGTVTITNSMATAIDAKGDLVAGTGADAFSRLAVGANDTVLTAASGEATGLKWAAPAGGGANWSLLNSGGTALSGSATVSVSGISGKDKILVLLDSVSSVSASTQVLLRLNGDNAANYDWAGNRFIGSSTYSNLSFIGVGSIGDSKFLFGTIPNNAIGTLFGSAIITGCNASGVKVASGCGGGNNLDGGNGQVSNTFNGVYNSSSTISSITITCSSGNFDAGTVYVYTSA